MKCEDCIEWEYFEGYGYGCFCMKTMTPIDANKCECYADKRPDVPHSWKPSKNESQEISDSNLKMWHNIYAEEKRRERSDKE